MESPPLGIDKLLGSLDLQETDQDHYRAGNVNTGGGVVFGGQLLGQAIVAANRHAPDKYVKTIHTIFARGGSMDHDVEIAVDVMHSGRAFASSTVTISQGDRLCCRSLVLLSSEEPDLIRHGVSKPEVGTPDEAKPGGHAEGAWEVRVVDGLDISDPDTVAPAELNVWSRFVGAPDDKTISQALLAFATDGFLIGTAMLPHAGVGQAQAHVTLSTGVVSHTLTFHEPVDAADWLLLAHRSPYAGRGRSYGAADVFNQEGALVASFVQDNMIREIPSGRAASAL
jgi:acyl-CoA thioesterase II